jgi:hypothetical protein
MPEYSEYQKKVIRRYYENREQGDEQRLAELVAELYLAAGKKRDRLWSQARECLARLRVPPGRIDHVVRAQDAALLAEVVKELEAGTLKRAPAQPVSAPDTLEPPPRR